MKFIENIFSQIVLFTTNLISSSGYFGVFILMAAESTMIPLPSELVLPFAGYLAYTGRFNFWTVCLVASIGTIFGSLFSYYLGHFLGEPFFKKYGSYVFVDKEDLSWTKNWFKSKGPKTIFFSRFIPVVRHLISIPAGIARMDLKKFILYTFLGGIIWNTFLTYLGYLLGEHWELVHKYSRPLSIVSAALIFLGAIYFVHKHFIKRKSSKNQNKSKNQKIKRNDE